MSGLSPNLGFDYFIPMIIAGTSFVFYLFLSVAFPRFNGRKELLENKKDMEDLE